MLWVEKSFRNNVIMSISKGPELVYVSVYAATIIADMKNATNTYVNTKLCIYLDWANIYF